MRIAPNPVPASAGNLCLVGLRLGGFNLKAQLLGILLMANRHQIPGLELRPQKSFGERVLQMALDTTRSSRLYRASFAPAGR